MLSTILKQHLYMKTISTLLIVLFLRHDLSINRLTEFDEWHSQHLPAIKLYSFGGVNAHIILTKDDRGQSLVLTGEDGKGGGKGKGKGKGGGGDQLVISGNTGGGGGSTNLIMQDAANREGDVVISGNSMIVPGEDGHIVLADGRNRRGANDEGLPQANPFAFWLPYLYASRAGGYNLSPFFGAQFG